MTTPTVTKQVIDNGPRNYVALYTCPLVSGDTLASYLAADPTSGGDMGVKIQGNTLYPGSHLKIVRLAYDVSSQLSVQVIWDATSATTAYILNGQGSGKQMFRPIGALAPASAGALYTGATGKILFTLRGTPAAGDFFSVQMWCRKDIVQ